MPLTDVRCRNAKAQIKPHKLSDGGGLHLLINPEEPSIGAWHIGGTASNARWRLASIQLLG
jgi:hypothetical protein